MIDFAAIRPGDKVTVEYVVNDPPAFETYPGGETILRVLTRSGIGLGVAQSAVVGHVPA